MAKESQFSKEKLSSEINMHKINIDRKVFTKTQKEKDVLKLAKKANKEKLKNEHGN